MLIRDNLKITQEEQKYLTNEVFQRFKNMMNDYGLEKVSQKVENLLNYNYEDIDEINITYKQTFDCKSLETLLNQYRNKN